MRFGRNGDTHDFRTRYAFSRVQPTLRDEEDWGKNRAVGKMERNACNTSDERKTWLVFFPNLKRLSRGRSKFHRSFWLNVNSDVWYAKKLFDRITPSKWNNIGKPRSFLTQSSSPHALYIKNTVQVQYFFPLYIYSSRLFCMPQKQSLSLYNNKHQMVMNSFTEIGILLFDKVWTTSIFSLSGESEREIYIIIPLHQFVLEKMRFKNYCECEKAWDFDWMPFAIAEDEMMNTTCNQFKVKTRRKRK